MAIAETPSVTEIGPRVKALREAMDLSLRDLAERCGVSAPMLSQVERGETSPTLQVAARIAAGLELKLSQLLRLDEDGTVVVVRAGERRQGPGRSRAHRYEILTPPLPGQRRDGRCRRSADARARQPRDRAGRVRQRRPALRRRAPRAVDR
jgi:XRE family transcriptional regulator, regulator of sulfur utilization